MTPKMRVYRVTLKGGLKITMLDMYGRGPDHALESVAQRFGHDQVVDVALDRGGEDDED